MIQTSTLPTATLSDAIEEGKTGLLFNPGDVADLVEKMKILIQDKALRLRMGEAAYLRCKQHFTQQIVVAATLNYYEKNFIDFKG